MEKIAEFVKKYRKILNLTQERLAAYAGVSTKFIIELEASKKTLQIDKVLDVLKVFDATLVPEHY